MGEEPDEVPGKSVYIEETNTEVYVHPMHHSDPVNPLMRVGEEMKEYVQESIDTYLQEDADVYMEQNLPADYEVEDRPVQEIRDHVWAEEEYTGLWKQHEEERQQERRKHLAYTLTLPIQAIVKSPIWMAKNIGENVLDIEWEDREQRREQLREKGRKLNDPSYLDEYETELREQSPPEPEQRDRLWEENPEEAVVRSERSRFIAEYVVEHADADEAHVFVGDAHYTGVLHWLQEYRDGVKHEADEVPERHRAAEGYLDTGDGRETDV